MTSPEIDDSPYARTSGPIHGWFELTYSSYQVVPRTLAQSMPVEWQQRFVACLEELRAAFAHIPQANSYRVEPGAWHYASEMSDAQLRAADVTCEATELLAALDKTAEDYEARYDAICDEHGRTFYDANGDDVSNGPVVFLPGPDPLPHYRHSYIEPAEARRAALQHAIDASNYPAEEAIR